MAEVSQGAEVVGENNKGRTENGKGRTRDDSGKGIVEKICE